MTAVTWEAEARFSASIQNRSSTKLSLTGCETPCTTKASWPRTLSSTRTKVLPSPKRIVSQGAASTPSFAQSARVRSGFALPAKIFKASSEPTRAPVFVMATLLSASVAGDKSLDFGSERDGREMGEGPLGFVEAVEADEVRNFPHGFP